MFEVGSFSPTVGSCRGSGGFDRSSQLPVFNCRRVYWDQGQPVKWKSKVTIKKCRYLEATACAGADLPCSSPW